MLMVRRVAVSKTKRTRAYSTPPSTRHSLALIDAFDTAWLGFIHHNAAWLYSMPLTAWHGTALFNTFFDTA
jgi:hypothetical protein